MKRISLIAVCCLAMAPSLALAQHFGGSNRHGGGNDYHGAAPVNGGGQGNRGNGSGNWNRGGSYNHGGHWNRGGGYWRGSEYGRGHYRGGGVSIHVGVSAPHVRYYRPNFGVYVGPRYQYRSPRFVVRYGTPAWNRGSWYYGYRSGSLGWWWGVNNVYYSYAQPVYPYPVAAPIVAEPVVEAPVNYYCGSEGQYYPAVEQCPEEWQVIPAQPAGQPQ